MSSKTTEERYARFMKDFGANKRAIRELHCVLDNGKRLPEQQSTTPLLPLDELARKLELVRKAEGYWKAKFTYLTGQPMEKYRNFSDLEVSAILELDYGTLYGIVSGPMGAFDAFLCRLFAIPTVVKMFATKNLSTLNLDALALAAARHQHFDAPTPSESEDEENVPRRKTKFQKDGKARRNSFFANKRRAIDSNRCVITGTRDPEVCHILPFAANSSEVSRLRWAKCLIVYTAAGFLTPPPGQTGRELDTRLLSLFTSKAGINDRHWNMISLAPSLYDWWGKGYFGLKYIGTEDLARSANPNQLVTLRLQFHWMVWRDRDISGKKPSTPFGQTVSDFKATFPELEPLTVPYCGNQAPAGALPVVAISRPTTGFNVESGDIIEVNIPQRHMDKMILAFDVQWALVKLLAMAGGAEALDDVPYHPDFLDENWEFPGEAAQMADLRLFADNLLAQSELEGEESEAVSESEAASQPENPPRDSAVHESESEEALEREREAAISLVNPVTPTQDALKPDESVRRKPPVGHGSTTGLQHSTIDKQAKSTRARVSTWWDGMKVSLGTMKKKKGSVKESTTAVSTDAEAVTSTVKSAGEGSKRTWRKGGLLKRPPVTKEHYADPKGSSNKHGESLLRNESA
ncbi:hypothetical protein OQA88_4664 [Cercophora sp. LCS_1]